MSYSTKRVHNVQTGEITEVTLTADEIAAREAERAGAASEETVRAGRAARLEQIQQAALALAVSLKQPGSQDNLTAAQVRDAVRLLALATGALIKFDAD